MTRGTVNKIALLLGSSETETSSTSTTKTLFSVQWVCIALISNNIKSTDFIRVVYASVVVTVHTGTEPTVQGYSEAYMACMQKLILQLTAFTANFYSLLGSICCASRLEQCTTVVLSL